MLHSRMERVSEMIKAKLAEIIDRKVTNPRIPEFVTVHSVKVARDLRRARVYVTLLADENEDVVREAVEALNRSARFIRSELARSVQLKYVPELKFFYNPSTRYALHIHKILEDAAPAPDNENGEVQE